MLFSWFFLLCLAARGTISSIVGAAADSKTSASMCGAARGAHFLDPDRYLDRAGVLELERHRKLVAYLERLPQLAEHHVIAARPELQRFARLHFQCRDASHPHDAGVDAHFVQLGNAGNRRRHAYQAIGLAAGVLDRHEYPAGPGARW